MHIIDVMKASELRIGNYVNDRFNAEVIVCDITHTGVNLNYGYSTISIDELKPIPLTEEWLLKFGFEKQDYNMSGCDIYKLKNIIIMKSFVNPERKNMGITVEGISPPTWSLKDLIHVHELQNLYFALTGEELVVKE